MESIEFLKKNGVDLNKCLELFEDIDTYNETLKGFNSSMSKKVIQIKQALEEEDMPNYAIYVHALKSDCKYFGFMKLANIAFEHEMASKDNNTTFVKEHIEELLVEVDKVQKLVSEYLGENESQLAYKFADINIEELPSGTIFSEEAAITPITADEIEVLDVLEEDIILVADDSEVVRVFVEKAFDDKYEIARACNGQEALKIIKEHENDNRIKAILLDLNMPKVDGFAVLEYLTGANLLKKMPTTIISGDSSKEAISRAFTYEIVDMINKPFSEQKIREAVDKTMNFDK